MKLRAQVILCLGLFQGISAYAEPDAKFEQLLALSLEDLMKININISTHTKQVLSKAPSVVSVITAEDIKATGATNLTEMLQGIPGVYVKVNLFGGRPVVTFRGAEPTHTLLMVNGIPLRDLVWNPGIFWRGLPTSMIERVEIIRGPGSALYGSEASAGVINIITKTSGKIEQAEANIRTGSFNTQEGWVQHAADWNGFELGFTAELLRTDGHDPFIARDGQTGNISYAPAYARYGYVNEDLRFSIAKGNWRTLADYTHKSDVETGLSGGGVLDPRTLGEDSRLNIQQLYSNEAFAKDWGLNAELHYVQLDYTSGDGFQERPPGYICIAATNCNNGTPGIYPDGLRNLQRSAERQLNFETSGLYTGLETHAISLGAGVNWLDLYHVEHWVNYGVGPDGNPLPAGGPLVNLSDSPYAYAPEKSRQVSNLFIQDVWILAQDWELTGGARYDNYSDFGGTANPRLALVWQSTKNLTTKLMYGQAFRAPSFLQLYALTASNTPNPNLAPEKSETTSLSFAYLASKDLKFGIDLYQFAQSNLIVADSTAQAQFHNTGSSNSYGVELEAMWQATKSLRISGNLSNRNDITNPYNPVPRQKAYLRTDLEFTPNLNWNVQANWIGKHLLPPGDTRAPIDEYTLVDTTIRYALRRDWEFAASLRNLFDVDARELSSKSLPDNLPLPGRSFYAEMRFKF